MKQKDKALSRLFPKNCPQKVGEGKGVLLERGRLEAARREWRHLSAQSDRFTHKRVRNGEERTGAKKEEKPPACSVCSP